MRSQYFARAGLTTYSQEFPSQGDHGGFAFQVNDVGGSGRLRVWLQHKDSEDTGFLDVNTSTHDLARSAAGWGSFMADTYVGEILRFKFQIDDGADGDGGDSDWVNWEILGYLPYDDQT